MRLEISFSRPTYRHTVARVKTVSLTNWFRIARCLLTSGVNVRATRASIQDRDPEITRSPDIWTTCIYGYRGPGILQKYKPARGSKRPTYGLNDYGLSCFINACFAGLFRERMAFVNELGCALREAKARGLNDYARRTAEKYLKAADEFGVALTDSERLFIRDMA